MTLLKEYYSVAMSICWYSQFWPFRISGGQRRMAVLDRTPVYTGSAKGSWDRCKRVQLYYQLITACQYNFNHIYMLFGN